MPPILADSLPLADPAWGMQAFTWGMLILLALGALIAVIVFFRRKPSVDVEFVEHDKDREALSRRVEILEGLLGLDKDHKALDARVEILEDLLGLDRDHKALADRVKELELRVTTHMGLIHRKLDDGAREFANLKSVQASNVTSIAAILEGVKDIKAHQDQRDLMIAQQFAAFTKQLNDTVRDVFTHAQNASSKSK